MANIRSKAIRGETVTLSIQYYGIDGLPVDPDFTPEILIKNLEVKTNNTFLFQFRMMSTLRIKKKPCLFL